ncbi:MAG: hypothetical protein KDC67_00595 [Ignavibacteriae bacterium]|nr:hypothetical protein [Ignavibacteriota bacterium]
MTPKKYLIIFIFLAFLIGCSDDSNPTEPENKTARELNIKEITVPAAMKQSNDVHAQVANAYINLANAFRGYSVFYTPPAGAKNLSKTNEDWARTWELDGLSVTMNYYETGTNFGWNIILNGTDGETTYNNWLFMEAQETIGASNGHLKIYKDGSSELETEWNYSTNSTGIYSFDLFMYSDENPEKLSITSLPDDSGDLTFYKTFNGSFVPESKVVWTAAGAGEWWEYDLDGNVKDNGTF